MGDQELIKAEDACAIPKWAPNRGMRYEVDDFIVSPPSNEEGGFFHLRYGQRSKPRSSTYDRINQELSMKIEVKDGDPVISDVGLSGVEKDTPGFLVSPTGLSPASSTATTPDTASVQRTKPLFVLDWKNFKVGGNKEGTEDSVVDENPSLRIEEDRFESRIIPLGIEQFISGESEDNKPRRKRSNIFSEDFVTKELQAQDRICTKEKHERSDSHGIPSVTEQLVSNESKDNKTRRQKSSFITEDYLKKEKIEASLVEKVQSLQVSQGSETPLTTPPITTPISTPLTTPQTSPIIKRKIANIVMDQGANHGYFCTKPFQGSQQNSDSSAYFSGGGGLSATSVQMTQQLESGSKIAAAMDPGQKIGKKRKPKPSTLREMNFWAPTSM